MHRDYSQSDTHRGIFSSRFFFFYEHMPSYKKERHVQATKYNYTVKWNVRKIALSIK